MKRSAASIKADICLILEGTYPYVSGGVSAWTHDLIREHKHLTFAIMALVPPNAELKLKYELPENVAGITNVFLQKLPYGSAALPKQDAEFLFSALRTALIDLQRQPSPDVLRRILDAFSRYQEHLGQTILLDSIPAWNMLLSMYEATMEDCAFLDFFWSWRALLGGMYSVLLADLPEANIYHALCTGYAGLCLTRAFLETGRPCIITEHGIYTNERRIEIASADWLVDQKAFSLAVKRSIEDRNLRDFWVDMFSAYSRMCYGVSTHIITLYEGNQEFQRMDGADPAKMKIIPNHIDCERCAHIKRENEGVPTIALIGRVVPIKDVKTFIRAVAMLRETIYEVQALIMGPDDEDEDYYKECVDMVQHMGLAETILFTGRVNIMDYLKKIDVVALTSISEAQPLVILEMGAAGIPCVATDVGACREMIMGRSDEFPPIGPGGAITPLSNPKAVAAEILHLLTDKAHYYRCGEALRARVRKYYNKLSQPISYREIYTDLMEERVKRHIKLQENAF